MATSRKVRTLNETRTKLKPLEGRFAPGTTQGPQDWCPMKMAKAIRRQALTAERVAATTGDAGVANEMRSLAEAFRSQADILKRKKKTKKK